MIYYMHSEDFFELYLENETEDSILDAQYLAVSSHIRKRDSDVENIVCLSNILYPNNEVLMRGSIDEMKKEYENQLEDNLPLLAEIIRGSLEDNKNIILICTKSEWGLKYLKWLAEYMMDIFEYPIYSYKKYVNGCPLYEYNKKKVKKKIAPIIEEAHENLINMYRQSTKGRKVILSNYKGMSKKELKKLCEKEELYYDGMSRMEMIDMLEAFL